MSTTRPNKPVTLLHSLPDLQMGGGQQLVLRNIAHSNRDRFRNTVCYFKPAREMDAQFRREADSLHFFDHRGFWSAPRVLWQLVALIRRQQVDIVHVQGTPLDKNYGQLAAWICSVPVVRTLHGMRPPAPAVLRTLTRPRPHRVLRLARNILQGAADRLLDRATVQRVVAVSDAVCASWRPWLDRHWLRNGRVTVINNAVPVDEFAAPLPDAEREDLVRDLGIEHAYPVLINVGRLTPPKGQDLLIPVLARLVETWPAARLLLVGEGESRDALRQAAREAGVVDHVLFLGRRTDTAALLAVSDLFVFSSRFEGFPLVVLEAMAAGKPVVAVQLPGLAAVLEDGKTGYGVPTRDADAFASVVSKLAADRDHARAVGRRARQLVEQCYNLRGAVHELERLYLSLLERPGSSVAKGRRDLDETPRRPSTERPCPRRSRIASRLVQGLMQTRSRDLSDRELAQSAVVFSPHFDDETLGCGGTIIKKRQAGADVKIVFLTDGSQSHKDFRPPTELAALRAQEGRAAARALGVDAEHVEMLGFAETHLGEHREAAVDRVAGLLARTEPDSVFVPYRYESPPDHLAAREIVIAALRRGAHRVTVYEYPIWFWYQWPWMKPRRRRRPPTRRLVKWGVQAVVRCLGDFRCRMSIADVVDAKWSALQAHRSQVTRLRGEPDWPILADVAKGDFLAAFFRDHECFARSVIDPRRTDAPALVTSPHPHTSKADP